MGEALKSQRTVREYLLGRISEESTLAGLEDLLFTDEEFCSEVALAEDELINEYVFGLLDDTDAQSFRATLAANPERGFKLELTQALREKALARNLTTIPDKPSFLASLIRLFRQPQYAGALALLLIAVVLAAVYFSRRGNPDELAELHSIYQKARPTEARISDFSYAPLPQLRGAPEPADQKRLRLMEIKLIEATEKDPNAQAHHALGVFDLTQQKYPEAVKEFLSALKFDDQNARIHNDLGSAHFQLAKNSGQKKDFVELAQSLEEFTKATELDGNLLEALFNKSLALQEFGTMPRQARESWTLYLQKDPSSQWAEEARKNLARLKSEQTLFKSDEDVLADFLAAYRDRDYERAQEIHNETKGLLKGSMVSLQLSRRYLIAKQSGRESEAKENIEAMTYLGRYEQEQHAEFFFRN
jgi:tetratricopeptide (TPR) repeat protein